MAECWICGRAMVTEPRHLPIPICKRAKCEPERDFLIWAKAHEPLSSDYETMERYA